MSTVQLAAVSYLGRYSGNTHWLYAYQLRRWFAWCESKGLDPLLGIQPAHVELYIHQLGDTRLMDSSIPRGLVLAFAGPATKQRNSALSVDRAWAHP